MDNGTKFCRFCGQRIAGAERFCRFCGKQLDKQIQSAQPVAKQLANQTPGTQPVAKQQGAKQQPVRRHSVASRIIAILLIGIIIFNAVDLLIPNKPKTPSDSNQGYTIASDNQPEPVGFQPDLKAIAKLEPQTAAVSNENNNVDVSGLHFDFFEWNLKKEDTLEVRDAGTVTIPDGTLRMLDFSLASGQQEFLTDVAITIPRLEGEEDAYIEWYDPEQKRWRPTAFDISDEQNCFILYTNHFSNFGIKTPLRGEGAEEYYTKMDFGLFDVINKNPETGELYPFLQEPIGLDAATMARIRSAEYPELTSILESDGLSAQALDQNSAEVLGNTLAEVLGYIDTADNITNDSGKKYIASLFKNGKELTSKGGKYLYAFSTLITLYNTTKELMLNETATPVLKNNAVGLTSAVVGGVGFFASAASAPYFTAAGALLTFGPSVYKAVINYPRGLSEASYFYYLNNNVYLNPDGSITEKPAEDRSVQLKMDGSGWSDAFLQILENSNNDPKKLEEDISALYYYYLDHYFSQPNEDIRQFIIENKKEISDSSAVGPVHIEYENQTVFEMEMEAELVFRYEEMDEYREDARRIIVENTKVYLYRVVHSLLNEAYRETAEGIANELVPYLNQKLIFEVETGTMDYFGNTIYAKNREYYSGEFDDIFPFSYPWRGDVDYQLEKEPIAFLDIKRPYYCPNYRFPEQFYSQGFVPHGIPDSDTIFICNRYYYMMVGSPTNLGFNGNGTDEYPRQVIGFTVPDDGGDTQIVRLSLKVEDTAEVNEIEDAGRYVYDDSGLNIEEYREEKLENAKWNDGQCSNLLSYGLTFMEIVVSNDGTVSGSVNIPLSIDYSNQPEGYENIYKDAQISLQLSGRVLPGQNAVDCTLNGTIHVIETHDYHYELEGSRHALSYHKVFDTTYTIEGTTGESESYANGLMSPIDYYTVNEKVIYDCEGYERSPSFEGTQDLGEHLEEEDEYTRQLVYEIWKKQS